MSPWQMRPSKRVTWANRIPKIKINHFVSKTVHMAVIIDVITKPLTFPIIDTTNQIRISNKSPSNKTSIRKAKRRTKTEVKQQHLTIEGSQDAKRRKRITRRRIDRQSLNNNYYSELVIIHLTPCRRRSQMMLALVDAASRAHTHINRTWLTVHQIENHRNSIYFLLLSRKDTLKKTVQRNKLVCKSTNALHVWIALKNARRVATCSDLQCDSILTETVSKTKEKIIHKSSTNRKQISSVLWANERTNHERSL